MNREELIKELRRAERYCLNEYSTMAKQAADLIESQQKEIERLEKCRHECKIDCLLEEYNKLSDKCSRVTAERDELINAVRGDCEYCIHESSLLDENSPCWHCMMYAGKEYVTGDYWEYGEKDGAE